MSTHVDQGIHVPSANWLALRKELKEKKRKNRSKPNNSNQKKRKLEEIRQVGSASSSISASIEFAPSTSKRAEDMKLNDLKSTLRKMVLGEGELSGGAKDAEKYIAIDCEMVGVGTMGKESSLARVSLVNFYGAVLLDEYVKQKERVTDYRTQWSGIRAKDLVKAESFEKVQKRVADLVKGKTIIGHALHHDLKALLLSHPGPMTRDTQICSFKANICKSNRIALRVLVQQELGATIQSGEHCSITDARAAMAIYHLHQQKFESVSKGRSMPRTSLLNKAGKSEQRRNGVSSGLSTVTKTAGVKMVHGKGKNRVNSEEYDYWASDDDWAGPQWLREPLGFTERSLSHGYRVYDTDTYDLHIPNQWDEM